MAAYLITYDLNNPGQRYDQVIQAIKDSSNGSWCTFWKSSYLIASSLTANQIVDNIKDHLDKGDKLIAMEVTKNYQGWLTDEQWKYIRENIF